MKFKIHSLLLIILLIITNFGCANDVTKNSTPTPDDKNKPVKIGAVITETGPASGIGKLVRRGLELGVEAANRDTKGPKIELVFEDSKNDTGQGLTAFNKLVNVDGVKLVIVQSTVIGKAVAPTAEQDKVLMFGTNIVEKGLAKGRNYVIRFYPDSPMSAATVSDYVKSRYKRMAVLYLQNAYGDEALQAFSKSFPGDGREIVFAEPVSADANVNDLRTLISKMLEKKPDAVFTPIYGSVSTPLIQQIREQNSNIQIIGDVPLANPTVYEPIGKAAEGMVLPATPMDGGIARTPIQEAFIKDYAGKFSGEIPSVSVVINYDAVRLLSDALANTDGSPEAVRKYIISQQNYNGLVPGLKFDTDGESTMELIPFRLVNGKLIAIEAAKKTAGGR